MVLRNETKEDEEEEKKKKTYLLSIGVEVFCRFDPPYMGT
jgi:hypothetical protein